MTPGGLRGVLPVDKPAGWTSHDVVARARRALGERRVGHTGTLDPFATGLLLLCVGEATRLAEYLTGLDKVYEATLRLGVATDSGDLDGAVVATSEAWPGVGAGAVEGALRALRGEVWQTPPALSAKKVGGVPAHRRVRRGEDVALEPRRIEVHELEMTLFDPPVVGLRVRCSSGTYVRALARDLGEALGVGAHLTALRRTAVGPYGVDGAVPVEEFEAGREAAARALLPPLAAVRHLPSLEVDAEGAADLARGRAVEVGAVRDVPAAAAVRDGELLAVGEVRGGRFHPRKVLVHA